MAKKQKNYKKSRRDHVSKGFNDLEKAFNLNHYDKEAEEKKKEESMKAAVDEAASKLSKIVEDELKKEVLPSEATKSKKHSQARELKNAYRVESFSNDGTREYLMRVDQKDDRYSTVEFCDISNDQIYGHILVSSKTGQIKNAIFINRIPQANPLNITAVLPIFKGDIVIAFTMKQNQKVVCNLFKVIDFVVSEKTDAEKITKEKIPMAKLIRYNSFKADYEMPTEKEAEEGNVHGTLINVKWTKPPFEAYQAFPKYVLEKIDHPEISLAARRVRIPNTDKTSKEE